LSSELAKDVKQPLVEIVAPINVERLAEAFKTFQEFKQRLLTKDDSVTIAGRQYLKKSAWRKWALACGVSDEIVSFDRVPAQGKDQDGTFAYRVVVRAFHEKSGRSSAGVAVASKKEKNNWSHEEHDIFTLAHTRAKNRAIADLVGGGEVSAEEMTSDMENRRIKDQNESPIPSALGPASPGSASDLNNEQLNALKWTQSTKLPQLSTIKITQALLGVPIAKLLFERLKASANQTSKIGDITYKLSATDEGTEFLQRWQANRTTS
jgi:hypothetical protein